jgi:hypothetical protein
MSIFADLRGSILGLLFPWLGRRSESSFWDWRLMESMVDRFSGLLVFATETVLGPLEAMWRRCSFMPSLVDDELEDGRRPLNRKGIAS